MTLKSLLEAIEQRPELFIGDHDINALRHFLAGYSAAMQEVDSSYDTSLFQKFTAFLSIKYNDDRDFDWATLIAMHEADNDTVSTFFRLLKEYHEQK